MYRKYFGLNSLPFKTTPDLEMFFNQSSRQEILEALIYTVSRGDGIVKVTGEVGSGKTMLLRLLASKLSSEFELVYINSPNLSAKDMLLYICSELGIKYSNDSQKFTLTNELKTKLVDLHAQGKKVVMLIDEAQAMTFDALEELRLLSNIETSEDKLLQMVLFGQPELDTALEHEQIRQFKSRITHNIYVPPLEPEAVQSYLNYRMRKAGYAGLDIFDLKVSKKITKLSNGLPRNINIIADKVLMSVFGTASKVAKVEHLKNLPDPELPIKASKQFNKLYYYFFIFVLVSIISFLSYLLIKNQPGMLKQDVFAGKQQAKEQSVDQPKNVEPKSLVNNSSVNNRKEIVKDLEVSPLPKKQVVVEKNLTKLDKMDSPQVSKLDYQIKNPNAILGNPQQLNNLMLYHSLGKRWIRSLNQSYVIQLSTRSIGSLEKTLAFYEKQKIGLDKFYIVIDFNQTIKKFRIKVFYKSSSSFTGLKKTIENLPSRVKRSKPYIVNVNQLVQNLHYTDMKLRDIGILNE